MNNPDKNWTVFDSIDTLRSAINDMEHGHHLILVDGKPCLDENIAKCLNGHMKLIKEHIAETQKNALTEKDWKKYSDLNEYARLIIYQSGCVVVEGRVKFDDDKDFANLGEAIHHIKQAKEGGKDEETIR